jgi:Domain of unknown function (DUF6265)
MVRGGSIRCTLLIFSALLAFAAVPAAFAQSSAGATIGGNIAGSATTGPMARTTASAPPVSASIVATVADFAWLEGTWRGEWGPRVAEQVWMKPQAGVMSGAFSLMETDKVLVIELFTIVQLPSGVQFNIRHFTPELAAWEKGDPTRLTLAGFDNKRFEFVNAVDGKPKKSILTRIDADTYVARSEIIPDTGDEQVIEITYHRVLPTNQPADKSAAKKRKT